MMLTPLLLQQCDRGRTLFSPGSDTEGCDYLDNSVEVDTVQRVSGIPFSRQQYSNSQRPQQPKKRWLHAACQDLSLWEDNDKQVTNH